MLAVTALTAAGCIPDGDTPTAGTSPADLSTMEVSAGPLNPSFNPAVSSYDVLTPNGTSSTTLTAVAANASAKLAINNQPAVSGQPFGPIALGVGINLVTVLVTAPNGSQNTYSIMVNRAAPASDNNLSGLTVTPGSLSPAFNASTLNYTVSVGSTVMSVNISATKSDANATMSGSVTAPPGQATGQGAIQLNGAGSSTPISIVVMAPNGSQKTYSIIVNRAAPASDNNLSSLSVTPGPLVPVFAAGTGFYTVTVGSTVTSVDVSATKADANATIFGSIAAPPGQATAQGAIQLNGAGSSTPISIVVMAPNGSQKTYTIIINRAAS